MIKRLLFFSFVVITLSNCSKTPYLPYHSTAGIEHQTRMVQTEMTLMNDESDETNKLSYAVIAAVDNKELPYILISPAKINSSDGKELWDYNISYSTTVHLDKAEELVGSFDLIIQKWDSGSLKDEGYFYEFTHTPEQNIFQQSENTEVILPTIMVNFNLTEKGSVGSLIIGEGEARYFYKFEKKEHVEKFRGLLQKALNELR